MAAATDNVLTMTARFDGSQLKAGLADAAQSVATSASAMGESFTTADSDASEQIQLLIQQVKELQTQLDQLQTHAANAGRATAREMTEARHAIHGLGEEIGVHVPRYLQSFITQLPGVGAALAAAFSVIAVVGLIELVVEAGKKLYELGKAGEEAADKLSVVFGQLRSELETTNDKLALSNAELDRTIAKLEGHRTNNIAVDLAKANVAADGLAKGAAEVAKKLDEIVSKNAVTYMQELVSGMKRTAEETQFVGEVTQHYTDVVNKGKEAVRSASGVQDKAAAQQTANASATAALTVNIERAESKMRDYRIAADAALVDEDKWEAYAAKIAILSNLIGVLKDEMYRLKEAEDSLSKQDAADRLSAAAAAAEKQIAIDKSVLEARKTTRTADIAANLQFAKDELAVGEYTYAQDIQAQRSAAQAKYSLLLEAASKERAIAHEGAAAGKDPTPEINAINAKVIAAKTELISKLDELDTEEVVHARDHAMQVGKAQIEATKASGEQDYQIVMEGTRELYAAHSIGTAQEVSLEQAAANKVYKIKQKAIQDELELLTQDKTKNEAAIITFNAELQRLAKDNERELAKIKADGLKQSLEEQRKVMNEELHAVESSANIELEVATHTDSQKLKIHRESLQQWQTAEHAAITKWAAEQTLVIQQQLTKMETAGQKETTEYKALQDKLIRIKQEAAKRIEDIDEQVQQKEMLGYQKLQSQFNSTFAQILSGHETWAQGMLKIEDSLLQGVIQNLLKMVEEHGLAGLKMIFQDAKTAAANAYQWGSASGGPILGAIDAAIAFAGVMAFGSFAQGGVVPTSGMHELHATEMVLPPHISNWVQNAANSSTQNTSSNSGGNTSTFNTTVNNHGGANMSHDDIVKQVKRARRMGSL